MPIRLRKTAVLSIPLLALCGCASVKNPASFGLEPGAANLVRDTCTDIMGLRPGHVEFDACGDSLAESVRLVQHTGRIMRAQQQCEQLGLEPGTAELSKCIVLTKRAPADEGSAAPQLAAGDIRSSNYYFSMTRPQQEQSVELSCAQLGLHPASGAFSQCVVDLRSALFVAQNPL